MMKTIGIIGGMSWESTSEYYRILNETVHERLGGLHSAKCVIVSVDFAEVEVLQREGRWDEGAVMMKDETTCIRCAMCASRCPTHAITMQHFSFRRECVSIATPNPKILYSVV